MTDSLTFFVTAIGIVLAAAGVYIIVPHLYRKLRTKELANICRRERLVALTYDDGPGSALTEKLLDCLKNENVRATFFVLGHRADVAENLISAYIENRHDVGSHTYSHLHAWKALPTSCAIDIERGRKIVDRLGGNGLFFRPTYGKLNIFTFVYVLVRRYRILWWTIDTADSQEEPKSIDRVLGEIDSKGGGVVLMHDFDHYKTGDHIDYVLTMTKAIITHARSNNMRLLPLSEIVDRPTGT